MLSDILQSISKLNSNSSVETFKPHYQKIDVAILSAMPEELEYFQEILLRNPCNNYIIDGLEFSIYEYKNKKILISHTGFGTTFAASVVTLIHQYFHPVYIFFSGTAGGINPVLKLCDVIIVDKAFEAEIQGAFTLLKGTPFEGCLTHPIKKQIFPSIYFADEKLLNIASNITATNSTIYTGTAVSSNAFPAPQELFDKIKTENPYSIDMETSAVYQVAWLLKIRVLAIRGISNLLNHDGTDDKINESDVKGGSEAAAKVVLKILDGLLIESDVRHPQEKNSCPS